MSAPAVAPPAVLPSGGAWLRVFLTLAWVGLCVIAWVPTVLTPIVWAQVGAMVLLGLWLVSQPGSAVVLFALAAVFADRIFAGSARLDGQLIALAVFVPLVHQLAAMAAMVPPRSSLRWSALLPTTIRYVGSVLITVLVLMLAGLTVTSFH